MTYSYEESKAILRHPAVHKAMERIVFGREIEPHTRGPTWRFADRDNCTAPFTLLAACVKRAVTEAMGSATGSDRERLLIVLRATESDSSNEIAANVAAAVEYYAVEMQFGIEGLVSYREHMKAHAPQ